MQTPNVQYFNLSITNINPQNSGLVSGPTLEPQLARLSINPSDAILDNMQDYYGSIIRFSVPCINLPLIQCLVQTPVLDINKMINSFTLSYNDILSDRIYWQFQPEVEPPVSIIPQENTPTQTFSNYYFLYQYQSIINIMNVALKNALANLKTKAGTEAIADSPDAFFYYDCNTNLIALYSPPLFDATNDLSVPILIAFNSPSSIFFVGVPYQFYGYSQPFGVDAIFRIQNNNTLNQKTINAVVYNITSQEFISLAYMSYLRNIFISTTMPVKTETFYINDAQGTQNLNYNSILTDFIPDISLSNDAGVSSKIFIYNAPSLFRVFEFTNRGSLYEVSAALSFSDTLGNIYPLYLEKGQAIEIKFMFIKKSVYNKFLI